MKDGLSAIGLLDDLAAIHHASSRALLQAFSALYPK